MRSSCILTGVRASLLIPLLVLTARADGVIHLNGYRDEIGPYGTTRSGISVKADQDRISAHLQRRVLGTTLPEAVDIIAEFLIFDKALVNEWRRQALAAFLQSPVRRKNTTETRLPGDYWAIYVEEAPLASPSDSVNNMPNNDTAIQLVTTTLSALNQLIARKEYRQMTLSRSAGDAFPAVVLPLEEIFADPKKWDGKRIRTMGWLVRAEEKSVLYRSRFSAWAGGEGIWVGEDSAIAIGMETLPRNYGGPREVEGVVRASMHGHLGVFCCTIDRLTINREPK